MSGSSPEPAPAASLNLDDFCRDVATALVQLAQVFPRPHNLFVEDIFEAEEPDEFGLHSNRYLACFAAVCWLRDEGYIRFEGTLRQEAIEQAVLSGAALSLLITPGRASERETLALDRDTLLARMRQALRRGSSTELRWVILELMQKMNERSS